MLGGVGFLLRSQSSSVRCGRVLAAQWGGGSGGEWPSACRPNQDLQGGGPCPRVGPTLGVPLGEAKDPSSAPCHQTMECHLPATAHPAVSVDGDAIYGRD